MIETARDEIKEAHATASSVVITNLELTNMIGAETKEALLKLFSWHFDVMAAKILSDKIGAAVPEGVEGAGRMRRYERFRTIQT